MDIADKRRHKIYIGTLARSLYWSYSKNVTGEPKRLRELPKEDQQIWVNVAKRAIRQIEKLDTEVTIPDAEDRSLRV